MEIEKELLCISLIISFILLVYGFFINNKLLISFSVFIISYFATIMLHFGLKSG